jgi:hypothetical protein
MVAKLLDLPSVILSVSESGRLPVQGALTSLSSTYARSVCFGANDSRTTKLWLPMYLKQKVSSPAV